ncbi:MAG TPA: hypothetical protein VF173_00505 [Thermoanaerobaculia bacterium]|nr:hypothetical protein [Thermoanaerobaculia bacterium]
MKKPWILACVLLLGAVAAFAQTPAQPPLTKEALAAILGQPAASSCATQPSGIRHATKRPAILTGKSLCTATANCDSGTVSCSSNVSTSSCTAVDRDCSVNEPGHVTCDGVTTVCPTQCSSTCTDTPACCKCVQTGGCVPCCRCDGGNFADCLEQCS